MVRAQAPEERSAKIPTPVTIPTPEELGVRLPAAGGQAVHVPTPEDLGVRVGAAH